MLAQAPLGPTRLGGVPLLAANLARGADWFCVAELMSASGGATGSGRDRLQAALAGGDSGASQPAMQDLGDAVLQLGYLPSQSRTSSAEDQRSVIIAEFSSINLQQNSTPEFYSRILGQNSRAEFYNRIL